MEMTHQALSDWLRLLATPGVGSETARRLLQAFGLPGQVFAQSQSVLRQVVSARVAEALQTAPPEHAGLLEATWRWWQEAPDSRAVIALGDAAYPAALLHTPDPPCLLYAQGRIERLEGWQAEQTLAIVGSRNPSAQGRLNAHAFARDLAARGLTIVSGMALGVDGAAHEGALEDAANDTSDTLRTIAVIGTGIDRVYPKQHLALAQRIVQHGLILSEYPLGTPALAENFPRRNRIISGLAQGTLVVEAALESGSLITARQALEQGREVFAIPGSIHSPQSKGCHLLIRQGAKLVESAQDILEELRVRDPFARVPVHKASRTAPRAPSNASQPSLLHDDHPLLACMGHDPIGLDALQARSGLETAHLQAQLLELELLGHIARLPGGVFQRLARA